MLCCCTKCRSQLSPERIDVISGLGSHGAEVAGQASGVAERYDDGDDPYTPVCIARQAQKQAGTCSTQGEHTF